MKKLSTVIIGIIILSTLHHCKSKDTSFSISSYFSNNMVVQRDTTILIWGRGDAKEKVFLTVNNKTFQTRVNEDSSWAISIPALPLGKEYCFNFQSANKTIELNGIVSGDVWLCGGQSNMELPVSHYSWCDNEVALANNKNIRYYSVPDEIDLIPASELPHGSQWCIAVGEDVRNISATAYFYAKYLQPEIDVPIGIISSNWSGTSIEPWLPRSVLNKFPQYKKELSELNANQLSKNQINQHFKTLRKTWDKDYYFKGRGMDEQWYLPSTDTSNWVVTKLSDGYWEDSKVGLDSFDGVVWYRTVFDLPTDHKKEDPFHIYLGGIKDYNTTWINGKLLGETFGSENWSDYYAPDSLLKDKNNELVVRVLNIEGKGGFHFHPLWGTPILNGLWYCRSSVAIDKKTFQIPQIVNVSPYSYPTIEYNAMIAPLTKVAIKGIIWYQGESNAGRAREYQNLFPAMIEEWRKEFKNESLPFYFVQLASYGTEDRSGNNNDWAELRESQAHALKLNNTAMATAIDIGDPKDIHPSNKQEVGRRLSLLALEHTYNKISDYDYPRISKVIFQKNIAQVFISSSSSVCYPSKEILGFSLAGKDKIFHPAIATYKNGFIQVSSSYVSKPIALRYAWGKNPGTLNLHNKYKLPLLPYRSDTWKGITDERVYDPNIVYF